jgi:hypothetical protein
MFEKHLQAKVVTWFIIKDRIAKCHYIKQFSSELLNMPILFIIKGRRYKQQEFFYAGL